MLYGSPNAIKINRIQSSHAKPGQDYSYFIFVNNTVDDLQSERWTG